MEGIFTLTESFSVTPPLRIRYVSMLLVSLHCLFRHTGILNLGKERMVQWTTPFMIGITKMILNSYIPPPSSGYSISFPNQPLHACQDSNLKLLVLETSTLPIELHTRYFFIIPALIRNLRADFLFLQAFFVTILMALTILSISSFLMRSVQESNLCR